MSKRTATGALSQKTVKLMVFKPVQADPKTWRRLKRANQLPLVGAIARNEVLRASKYLGRAIWRKWSGCHRRSRA